jgi:hypothetical protein
MYATKYYFDDVIEKDEVRVICSSSKKHEKYLVGKTEGKGTLGKPGRILLKRVLKKQ